MTDEKFVFIEDSKDKKRTARSAKNKVGKGSKKVRFPSDFLTKKELENMNSDVRTYDLTKPMKWAEYKAMPEDLRKAYLLRLRNLYNVGSSSLAKMFGVSDPTVTREWKLMGVPQRDRRKLTDPAWESFIRYSGKEVSTIGDLIPPELKAKLDEYEEKHPPAVIAKDEPSLTTEAPSCGENIPHSRLSAKDYGSLNYVSGCLSALRAIYATDTNYSFYDGALCAIGQIIDSVEVYT